MPDQRFAATLACVTALAASPAAAQTPVVGTAYDSVAAAPLAGAVVQLADERDPARTFGATADSLGRYRIDAVPPGRYVAGLIHPSLDLLGLDATLGVVTVRADSLQRLDLAVPNGARTRAAVCGAPVGADAGVLVGQVRDADSDAPLNDARVVLSWREIAIGGGQGGRVEQRRAQVDVRPGGYFALCGVPTDDQLFADADAPGHRAAHLAVRAAPAGVTRRDFALGAAGAAANAGAAVSGTVRRPDGRPAAGASVLVLGLDARATTDDAGRFALGGLPAGTYAVEARALGFQPATAVVALSPRRAASADVALGARVTTLETVRVLGAGSRTLRAQQEFLSRMEHGAAGRFVTPPQIAKMTLLYASDVFHQMPGVEVLDRGAVGAARGGASRQVWMLARGSRCSPDVYLDGVRVQDGGLDFDALVSPSRIMAVEVYRTRANVPAEYAPTADRDCGVILVWSKPY